MARHAPLSVSISLQRHTQSIGNSVRKCVIGGDGTDVVNGSISESCFPKAIYIRSSDLAWMTRQFGLIIQHLPILGFDISRAIIGLQRLNARIYLEVT